MSYSFIIFRFFYHHTATPDIHTLSLHDALPIFFAPVGKQAILKARALDRLEVDRRDNLVGIHIRITQRNANAGVRGELFHFSLLSIRLRSLIRGLIRSRRSEERRVGKECRSCW